MYRFTLLFSLLVLALCHQGAWAASAAAQPEADAADAAEADAAEADAEDMDLEEEAADEPQLRPPTLDPITIDEDDLQDDPDDGEGDPGDDSDLLDRAEPPPPSSDPTRPQWTAPQTVFTLHGYMRARAELMDTFFLGREPQPSSRDLPFELFIPADRNALPDGGCRGSASTMPDMDTDACSGGSDRLRFMNMRMRLRPTLSLSDDVRVHMMLDVFDNLVFGSTPESSVYIPPGAPGGTADEFTRPDRTPTAPIDTFSSTSSPPQALRNGLRDSLYVRRAWAEVTNRGLGQLRFGRMGSHWGLGILANSGDGIDSDFSSDVDRVMALTQLAGLYWVVIRDFVGEGYVLEDPQDLSSIPFDATQRDDIDQWAFAIARRTTPEEQEAALQRGDWVLNAGAYFVWRKQFLTSAGISTPFATRSEINSGLVRRNAKAYIPDVWVQFLYGDLRLEAEAVMIAGRIQNLNNDSFERGDFDIRQFGAAVEAEYRLLDGNLGLRFYGGFASGDADVDGLSARQGLLAQTTDDRTISAFRFHPNYRVDLILWRSIMGRISGAWYMRPGVSYDIIRNPFGRLFGARVDVVYSRAHKEVQTYGSDPNLGLEIDATIYYRSEDGPGMTDGFYAQFQYGILFPLAGLGYPTFEGVPAITGGNPGLSNAQTLRLIMGVQF